MFSILLSADGVHCEQTHTTAGVQIVFFVFFSLCAGSLIRSVFRKSMLPYTVILLLFGMLVGLLENYFEFAYGGSAKQAS
jgi:hypothetical protein